MHNIDIKNGRSKYLEDLRSSNSINETQRILKDFNYHQVSTFRDIGEKVDGIEQNVKLIDKMILKMEEKIKNLMDIGNQSKLLKLKEKQSSFIIN